MNRAGANLQASRRLTVKLLFLVATLAVTGVALLSYRQGRLAAAHELAALHRAARDDGRAVLRIRQEIADRLTLPSLRTAAARLGVTDNAPETASAAPVVQARLGMGSPPAPVSREAVQ